jgi:hypothetical protein
MPQYNRTGPSGMGPMTGRGRGYCSGLGSTFDRSFVGFRKGWLSGICRRFGGWIGTGFSQGANGRAVTDRNARCGRGLGMRGGYQPW